MARDPKANISYPQAVLEDVAVGIAAGVVAAGAMHLFQVAWAKAVKAPSGTPATAKAADAVSEAVQDRPVRKGYRHIASNSVHYLTGAAIGGAYGLLAGLMPGITLGRGFLFGASTWLMGDEVAVPALDLGPPPSEVEGQTHVYGALSHAVFALTLDQVRRILNQRIAQQRQKRGRLTWL